MERNLTSNGEQTMQYAGDVISNCVHLKPIIIILLTNVSPMNLIIIKKKVPKAASEHTKCGNSTKEEHPGKTKNRHPGKKAGKKTEHHIVPETQSKDK